MSDFTTWALARAKEPSTYSGLAVFVGGLTFIPAADLAVIVKIVALLATVIPGALAIVLPEGSATPTSK